MTRSRPDGIESALQFWSDTPRDEVGDPASLVGQAHREPSRIGRGAGALQQAGADETGDGATGRARVGAQLPRQLRGRHRPAGSGAPHHEPAHVKIRSSGDVLPGVIDDQPIHPIQRFQEIEHRTVRPVPAVQVVGVDHLVFGTRQCRAAATGGHPRPPVAERGRTSRRTRHSRHGRRALLTFRRRRLAAIRGQAFRPAFRPAREMRT